MTRILRCERGGLEGMVVSTSAAWRTQMKSEKSLLGNGRPVVGGESIPFPPEAVCLVCFDAVQSRLCGGARLSESSCREVSSHEQQWPARRRARHGCFSGKPGALSSGQLLPYAGQCVAWSLDGTRIVASGQDMEDVE